MKGTYPTVYVVRDRESLSQLFGYVRFAYSCACGTLYAWRQHPDRGVDWRPLCPSCIDLADGELFIRRSKFAWADANKLADGMNAMGKEDGVYVDVSCRDLHMTLGFVIVKDERAKFLSCSASNHTNTAAAECEAVLLAEFHWPDIRVFCDHKETCERTGAVYIDRKRNNLAHRVARERINFKGWIKV